MSDAKMAAAPTPAPRRDRSPQFPYLGLSKAIERVQKIYEKARRHEVRVADIAADWGLSAKSSSTDRTVAALLSYGLVEESGSGDGRKIKVTDAAWRILDDTRPGVRDRLLGEAALKPSIIAEYARLWRDGRPDDTHALSQLKFEGKFTDDGASQFLRVFDDTMRFTSGLTSDSVNAVGESGRREEDGQKQDVDQKPLDPPAAQQGRVARREAKPGMKEDVFTLKEGDVVFQWPERLSPESYEDLEAWTKLILRKVQRHVTRDELDKPNAAEMLE